MPSFVRALALRAATPRIEAFLGFYAQRYAKEEEICGVGSSWVEWDDGKHLCSAEEVVEALGYTCGEWMSVRGSQKTCAEGKLNKKAGWKGETKRWAR